MTSSSIWASVLGYELQCAAHSIGLVHLADVKFGSLTAKTQIDKHLVWQIGQGTHAKDIFTALS